MTERRPRPDVHLLAELDAGLLDEAHAREVRAAAAADPAAQAVLDALATTRAELAALPEPPVPAALAARWSAALTAEQHAPRPTPAPPAVDPPGSPSAAIPAPTLAPTSPPAANATAQPTPVAPVSRPSAAAHPTPDAAPTNIPAPNAAPTAAPTAAPAHPLRTPQAGSEATEAVRGPDAPTPPPTRPPTSPSDPRRTPHPPPGPRHTPLATPALRGGPGSDAGRGPRASREDPGAQRPHPHRAARLLRRPAVLAAVLLVAVAVVAALRARTEAPPAPTVGRPQLVAEAMAAVGARDTAGLDDPTRRAACLRAVGGRADAPLLGGRRVTFEGNPGVLLVLGTGQRGTFDVLIVDADCGPKGGRLLAAVHVAPS